VCCLEKSGFLLWLLLALQVTETVLGRCEGKVLSRALAPRKSVWPPLLEEDNNAALPDACHFLSGST